MSETITHLPLAQLRESPTNPRRHYSDAGLQELADSIAVQGVMSPIIVRPLAQADIEATHEIVFGHRRFRAARLAGLAEVPAIVRDMSDADAAVAQIHENLHRADVHAVEEADAFRALMQDHGMTVEQIVSESGKSRSYVYGRLKLANISPKVREACQSAGLGAEIALLIARLPHHKLQDEALKRVRQGDEWVSFRYAKNALQSYIVPLNNAPFDLADKSMPGGACSTCPKLACNDPDLAELPADACIDRPCFDAKVEEQAVRVVALARETGQRVIEGVDARKMLPSSRYAIGGDLVSDTAFERVVDGVAVDVTWQQAIDELSPDERARLRPVKVVHPDRPHDPVDVLLDADQAEVLRLHGVADDDANDRTSYTASLTFSAGGGGTELSAWTAAELAVRSSAVMVDVEREVILAVRSKMRTAAELHMVLKREFENGNGFGLVGEIYGWEADEQAAEAQSDGGFSLRDWYHSRIDALSADEAAAIVVALAVNDFLRGGPGVTHTSAKRTVAIAATYGVDVLALAGQQQADEPAAPAAHATTSAPSQQASLLQEDA